MSNNEKNEAESRDIIEEIIPGKNNEYIDKSINQNNNNNQQSFIENYNEEESAQAVIEASEESKKSMEINMNEAGNQRLHTPQAITDTTEQTTQATWEIAENYLEFQKQAINSFQSVFMSYFQNVQNQLWNSQEYFKSISEMYSKLVTDYSKNVIVFSRMWNDIAFANAGLLKN
ncbi:MAG: hypothetical protein L0H53_09785 [Candidatus Nitrosocosmicus sp.]|nr:hypothetical protein [Candidatus Nitrosocosmicus sp.]MDN5868948.1 hypothetical protein [Candidatus Nitrosocosmicus sp.]